MNLIAVKYTGRKPYKDKTSLRNQWQPGDVKSVPEQDATKILLRFAEFERAKDRQDAKAGKSRDANEKLSADEAAAISAQVAAKQRAEDERAELEGILMTVETMDKVALEEYAKKYETDLDRRKSVDKLRTEVVTLIEQYGAR